MWLVHSCSNRCGATHAWTSPLAKNSTNPPRSRETLIPTSTIRSQPVAAYRRNTRCSFLTTPSTPKLRSKKYSRKNEIIAQQLEVNVHFFFQSFLEGTKLFPRFSFVKEFVRTTGMKSRRKLGKRIIWQRNKILEIILKLLFHVHWKFSVLVRLEFAICLKSCVVFIWIISLHSS